MGLKVAVLCGGTSQEREVSLASGRAVADALAGLGYEVTTLEPTPSLWDELRDGGWDCAFIALHGRGGEDGKVQAVCELLGVPHTGSGVLASALCMDKVRCNHELRRLGLTVPEFEELGEETSPERLIAAYGLPLVVKPVREGSTIGLSIVERPDQVLPAIARARASDPRVMVQRFVGGVEITVGVLEREWLEVLPLVEITYASAVYDYQAKYTPGGSRHHIPARIPAAAARRIGDQARAAFVGLGCQGLARIDFIVTSDGEGWVLEVNTVPGLTSLSLFPDAARAAGLEFPQLCETLVESARRGHDRR